MRNNPGYVFNVRKEVDAQADLLGQELERLCKILSEAGLPKDYLKALSWQMVRANFHANQAFDAANADTQSAKGVEVCGTDWKEPDVIAIAETIACVHAMHAMADTILKMINDLLLSKRIEEIKVSFENILKKLEPDSRFKDLRSKLSDLELSKEFKYIHALCNTVKHNYDAIPPGKAAVVPVGRGELEQGIVSRTFEYQVKSERVTYFYLSLWAREIYLDYRGEMFRLVAEVIKEISALIP